MEQTTPVKQPPPTWPSVNMNENEIDLYQILAETLLLEDVIAPDNPPVAAVPTATHNDFQMPPPGQYTDLSSNGPNHDWNSPPSGYYTSEQIAPTPQQIYAPPPQQIYSPPAVAEFAFPAASASCAVQNIEVRDECVPVRKRANGGQGKINKDDPRYKEHRRRNNVAVWKSRQKKARQEQLLIARKDELQTINDQLKLKNSRLKKEVELLRYFASYITPCDPNITPML